MKITLIPERCIACGLCQTYSELFDYHDNWNRAFYDNPDQLEKEISPSQGRYVEAVRNCPTRDL